MNLSSAFFNNAVVGQWVCVFTTLVIIIVMHRVCWVVPGEVYGATVRAFHSGDDGQCQAAPHHAILA